jgi:hypothetical protein
MNVGIALQQATKLGLVLTNYDYMYGLSAWYKFMDGLTKIFACRSSLSVGNDSRADTVANYDGRNVLSNGYDCRPGTYNIL